MPLNLKAALAEHNRAVACVEAAEQSLAQVADRIAAVLSSGGRVFVCGNGGSAADAQHFAAELTGRYQADRPGFPVIALTTDTSALTAIGNDYGFEAIFARQLASLARQGDALVVISTSGNSANIVRAAEYARQHGMHTIGLLGRDGGQLKHLVDYAIVINAPSTARIQEAHILVLHLLCETFEPSAHDVNGPRC